jgi:hypothetical protein
MTDLLMLVLLVAAFLGAGLYILACDYITNLPS